MPVNEDDGVVKVTIQPNTAAGATEAVGDLNKVSSAAENMGATTEKATQRTLKGFGDLTRFLNSVARQVDPFGAAIEKAKGTLERLNAVIAAGGIEGAGDKIKQAAEKASAMLPAVTAKVASLETELEKASESAIKFLDTTSRFEQLQRMFDPATSSAKKMTQEIALLNEAQRAGVNIAGGYTAAFEKIVLKYNDTTVATEKYISAQKLANEEAVAFQRAVNQQYAPGMMIQQGQQKINASNSMFNEPGVQFVDPILQQKIAAQNAAVNAAGNANRFQSQTNAAFAPGLSGDNGELKVTAENSMLAAKAEAELAAEMEKLAAVSAKWKAQIDPMPGLVAKYKASLQELNEAYQAGFLNIQQVAAATKILDAQFAKDSVSPAITRFQELESKFDLAGNSAKAMARDIAELDEAVTRGVTIFGGYDAALKKIQESYMVVDIAAKKAMEDQAAEFQKLTNLAEKYKAVADPIAAIQAKNAEAVKDINTLNAKGFLTDQQAIAAKAALNKKLKEEEDAHNNLGKAVDKGTASQRQAAFAATNLSFQVNDVISGLASGQPVFQIFTQQTGQIVQAFQQGGGISNVLKEFGSLVGRLINPLTLTAAAIIAVGAALIYLWNRADEAVAAVRKFNIALGPGASQEAIKGLQDASIAYRNLGLSASEANAKVRELSQNNPKLNFNNPTTATTLINTGADVAGALGFTDATKGVERLQQALAAGSAAMVELGLQTKAISPAQAKFILDMDLSGNRTQAQTAALNLLSANLKGQFKNNLGEGGRAFLELKQAWQEFLDSLTGPALYKAGTAVLNYFKSLVVDIKQAFKDMGQGVIDAYEWMKSKMPTLPDWMKGAQDPNNTGWRERAAAQAAGQPGSISPNKVMGDVTGYASNFSIQNGVVLDRPGAIALADALSHAAEKLAAAGERIELVSGADLKHTEGSDHYKTGAVDYYIYRGGEKLQGKGATGEIAQQYTNVYKDVRSYMQYAYPELVQQLVFGGNILTQGKTGVQDFIHIGLRPNPGNLGLIPGERTPGGQVQEDPAKIAEINAQNDLDIKIKKEQTEATKKRNIELAVANTYNDTYNASIAAGQNPQQAEFKATNMAIEVRKQLNIELGKGTEATDIANRDLAKVAAAYGQSTVAGLQAAAMQEAVQKNLQDGIPIQTAYRVALESRAAAAAAGLGVESDKTQELINAQERELAGATKGTAAQREAVIANEAVSKTLDARNAAQAAGNKLSADEIDKITQRITAQTKEKASLQAVLDIRQKINQTKDQIKVVELEAGMQNRTSEEISKQVALLQKKIELENLGFKPSDAIYQEALKYTAALGDANIKLAESQRLWQTINGFIQQVGDAISTFIGDKIAAIFDPTKVQDWGKQAKQVMGQIASSLVQGLIVKPAIGSVLSAVGLTGAAQQFGSFGSLLNLVGGSSGSGTGTAGTSGVTTGTNVTPSGGSSSGIGTLLQGLGLVKDAGSVFGGGSSGGGGLFSGIGNFINNSIGGPLGFATSIPTDATALAALPQFGALFPSVAPEALAGYASANAGILGAGTLAGEGGIAGALGLGGLSLSSIAGPIGLAVGILSLSGVLDGLFSKKPPNLATGGIINAGTGLISGVISSGNAQNDATAKQIGDAFSSTIAKVMTIPGAKLPAGAIEVQAGSRDGIKIGFLGEIDGQKVQIEKSFKDAQSAISAGLIAIRDNITGVTENTNTILHHITDPSQIDEAIAFAAAYDKLSTAAENAFADIEKTTTTVAGPFETAMNNIKTTFQGLTDQANKFGVSLDPVNAGLEEATKRIQGDFRTSLQALFDTSVADKAGTVDFQNLTRTAYQSFQQNFREAGSVGLRDDPTVIAQNTAIYQNALNNIFTTLSPDQLGQIRDRFAGMDDDIQNLTTSLIAAGGGATFLSNAAEAAAAAQAAAAQAAKDAAAGITSVITPLVDVSGKFSSLKTLLDNLIGGDLSGKKSVDRLKIANDNFQVLYDNLGAAPTQDQLDKLAAAGTNTIQLSTQAYGNAPQTAALRQLLIGDIYKVLGGVAHAEGGVAQPGWNLIGERGREWMFMPDKAGILPQASDPRPKASNDDEMLALLRNISENLDQGNKISRTHGMISEKGFQTVVTKLDKENSLATPKRMVV